MRADLRRHHQVHWVDVENDVVALDPRSGAVHVLEGATAVVWRQLDGATQADLVHRLTRLYEVPYGQVSTDVRTALDLLRRAFLLDETASDERQSTSPGNA